MKEHEKALREFRDWLYEEGWRSTPETYLHDSNPRQTIEVFTKNCRSLWLLSAEFGFLTLRPTVLNDNLFETLNDNSSDAEKRAIEAYGTASEVKNEQTR